LALATASCGIDRQAAEPPSTSGSAQHAAVPVNPDSEVTIVTFRVAATLDPVGTLSASYLRSHGAGEALMKIGADGSVQPELARSLEQSSPTTWTLTLRPNVTFWSGAPVDAGAVKASLERTQALDSFGAGFIKDLDIAVVDPLTLRLTTPEPRYSLPSSLAFYQLLVHNAASYGPALNGNDTKVADLTGPLRPVSFTPKSEMVLERNPRYWGPAIPIRKLTVREVADPQARAQVALAGQATIVQDIPADRAKEVRDGKGPLSLVTHPAANTNGIYLNPTSAKSPALGDPRVRQALAWGTDRAQLVELATEGLSKAMPSWLASNPQYPEAARQGFTAFDGSRAGRLLDEAGWRVGPGGVRQKDGQDLTVRLMTWGTEKAMGEVVQAQWRRLGVKVELSHGEHTVISEGRKVNDWDAFTEAWSTLGDTPTLLSNKVGRGGTGNYAKIDDPTVEALLAKVATAPTEAERKQAALDLNSVMVEVVPLIPTYPRLQLTAVAKDLRGFVPHPLQYENIIQPTMGVVR
ncbi:MAG TPA: ABC transporter substrate-binding protein, partial [Acidimicrobiales bacterium]|nr:ABC transporter substrate-binding protein [Acidimicrobiales bacterium]